MQNPQQPRERIKRPEFAPPQFQPPEPEPENEEGLTQDELNEWLTQKIIRLELGQFRKEAKEAASPIQRQRIEMPRPAEPVKKPQPYEAMYGTTEDDLVEKGKIKKPKGKSKVKSLIIYAAIIIIASILIQVGLVLFGGYSFLGQ